MAPVIAVLNGAANWLLRLFGYPAESRKRSTCTRRKSCGCSLCRRARTARSTRATRRCWPGVFDFHEKKAYDVMRPRTEVAALDDRRRPRSEVWEIVRRERYSRYPVYREYAR